VDQMKLQQEVFSLKRLSLVFLVVMVFLSLATLATSFAAATLAKDTDVKNGRLVQKNGGGTVATSSAATTFILSEGATPSTGRRTQASGVLSIPRVDADAAWEICDTTYIRLERSCTDNDVSTIVEVPICPSSTESKTVNSTTGDVYYKFFQFPQSSGNFTLFDCPFGAAPCTVYFPDTTQGCSNNAVTQVVANTPVVPLGSASYYAILTKASISTVPASNITGDIAVSPIAATAMTGFSLDLAIDGQSSTDRSSQVTGKAFGASYGGVTAGNLTVAVGYMGTAYTDAYTRPNSNAARINLGGGLLGGALPGGPETPLTSGVYTFFMPVSLKGDIHFKGAEHDVFIIQISKTLGIDANYNVILDTTDGKTPSAKNIFWAVAETVSVGAGAHMKGIILGFTAVTFVTGSSLEGRVLAQTACTLQSTTVDAPAKGVGF
jgi:hypothetical protein